jgi:hypothetical protein
MSATKIIMFISAMLLVTIAVTTIFQTTQNTDVLDMPETVQEPYISQVEVYGVQDSQAQYVRFEITGGDQQDLEDALIRLHTSDGTVSYQLQ